jgi:PAS domain S-box-containing protein
MSMYEAGYARGRSHGAAPRKLTIDSSVVAEPPGALVLADIAETICACNAAARDLFEHSPDEAIGHSMLDRALPHERREESLRRLRDAFDRTPEIPDAVRRRVDNDGSARIDSSAGARDLAAPPGQRRMRET